MAVKTAQDINLRWAQGEVFNSERRFRVLVAGRRFGKSYLSCIELIKGAINKPGETFFLLCTYISDGEGHSVEDIEEIGAEGMDSE